VTARAQERSFVRGRLVVRLRPGQAAPGIQALRDIRRGAGAPSLSLGVGSVDHAIRKVATGMLVARAFPAAARLHRVGESHRLYDELEETLGLSRTFRIAVGPDVDVKALCDRLRGLEAVEEATPLYLARIPVRAADASSGAATRARRDAVYDLIGADAARAMEPGDPAVLLGLVDSGVALEHPELAQHLRAGVDTVALAEDAMPAGMKLVTPSSPLRQRSYADDQGHGTACASIMAARGLAMHGGLGGAGALVVPAKALAAVEQEEGLTAVGSLADIDHAVKVVVDLGARVINLSFGTPASLLGPDDPIPHEEVVRYALARGCILVAASGNDGDDDPFYPAALPGVIAVSAVDPQGRPSAFSSFGPHVALCAPGEDIPIASLQGYSVGSGTSFAAPFVTAAAALLQARALRQATPLDSEGARRVLTASARAFAAGAKARGFGAGVLDVPAALRAVDAEIASGALAAELSEPRTATRPRPSHPISH
jgi:subtilisin family serine protease